MSKTTKKTASPPSSVRLCLYFHEAEWSLRELFLLLAAMPGERERAGAIRHVLTFGCRLPVPPHPVSSPSEAASLSVRITLSAKDPWLLPLLQEVSQRKKLSEKNALVKKKIFQIYASESEAVSPVETIQRVAQTENRHPDQFSGSAQPQPEDVSLAPAGALTHPIGQTVIPVKPTDSFAATNHLAEVPAPLSMEESDTSQINEPAPSNPHPPTAPVPDREPGQDEVAIVRRKSASFREKMRMSANMLKQQN